VNYRLAPGMALRREPFGGIAYSYADRRLQTIRSVQAVEVALRLDAGETREAVAADLGTSVDHIVERLVRAGVLCADL
jgi:putative mycofactocin binding protein MftB